MKEKNNQEISEVTCGEENNVWLVALVARPSKPKYLFFKNSMKSSLNKVHKWEYSTFDLKHRLTGNLNL